MPSFTDKDISAKPKRGSPVPSPGAPSASTTPADKSNDFNPKPCAGYFDIAMLPAVLVDTKELPLTKEATSCRPLTQAKLDEINASILKLRPQGR